MKKVFAKTLLMVKFIKQVLTFFSQRPQFMNTALLQAKTLVDSYLAKAPRPLSSFSFVPIFAWSDFFDFGFEVIGERLCVFAKNAQGSFLYLPPLGGHVEASTVEACFARMAENRKCKGVARVENIPENLLSAFHGSRYNQYTKPAEYVYRKEDLAALVGNAYKSQRHDCNHFKAHHAHGFAPYTDEDFVACMGLYDRWAAQRALTHSDGVYRAMLEENRRVHERLMRHWRALGLVGRVLKADGRVVGYSFGYALDEAAFCVYAEVADLNVRGAGAALFNRFCADEELKSFTWINTMDDFAMPNVAVAKRAYHPNRLISSYVVSQGS